VAGQEPKSLVWLAVVAIEHAVPQAVRILIHVVALEASGTINHGDVAAALVLTREPRFALVAGLSVDATPTRKQHISRTLELPSGACSENATRSKWI
jgi:hypothetical protein